MRRTRQSADWIIEFSKNREIFFLKFTIFLNNFALHKFFPRYDSLSVNFTQHPEGTVSVTSKSFLKLSAALAFTAALATPVASFAGGATSATSPGGAAAQAAAAASLPPSYGLLYCWLKDSTGTKVPSSPGVASISTGASTWVMGNADGPYTFTPTGPQRVCLKYTVRPSKFDLVAKCANAIIKGFPNLAGYAVIDGGVDDPQHSQECIDIAKN